MAGADRGGLSRDIKHDNFIYICVDQAPMRQKDWSWAFDFLEQAISRRLQLSSSGSHLNLVSGTPR